MADVPLDQLSRQIADGVRQCQGAAILASLGETIMRLLAAGEPRVAVLATLKGFPPLEWADDRPDTVVGLGITLRPTPHRFVVHGRQLYTWCALDTLILPRILGADVQVASPCPETGTEVRLHVGRERVHRMEPDTAVVSVVPLDAAVDLRAAFCDQVHFFRSADDAAPWLARHPEARVVSLPEGFALAQQLHHQLMAAGHGTPAHPALDAHHDQEPQN